MIVNSQLLEEELGDQGLFASCLSTEHCITPGVCVCVCVCVPLDGALHHPRRVCVCVCVCVCASRQSTASPQVCVCVCVCVRGR